MTLKELLSSLKDGLVIKVSIPKDSYELMTIRSYTRKSYRRSALRPYMERRVLSCEHSKRTNDEVWIEV